MTIPSIAIAMLLQAATTDVVVMRRPIAPPKPVTATQPTQPNLVIGGDFDAPASAWTASRFLYETLDGRKVLHLKSTGVSSQASGYQIVQLAKGGNYTISYDVLRATATCPNTGETGANIQDGLGGYLVEARPTCAPVNTWTTVSVNFTNRTKEYVTLYMGAGTPYNIDFYFDNLRVAKR